MPHRYAAANGPHKGHGREERIIVRLAAAIHLGVELALLHAAEVACTALVPRLLPLATLPRERCRKRGVVDPHVDRAVLARVRRRRVSRVAWRAERGGGRFAGGEELACEPVELVADGVAGERAAAVGVRNFEALLWSCAVVGSLAASLGGTTTYLPCFAGEVEGIRETVLFDFVVATRNDQELNACHAVITTLTGRYIARRMSCNHPRTAPPSAGAYATRGQCPAWARRTRPAMQTSCPRIYLENQSRTRHRTMKSGVRMVTRDAVYEDDLVDWVIEVSRRRPAKVVHLRGEI